MSFLVKNPFLPHKSILLVDKKDSLIVHIRDSISTDMTEQMSLLICQSRMTEYITFIGYRQFI